MTSPNDPQPFLKGTDVVSVNNTGAWAIILSKENLTIDAKSDKIIRIDADGSNFGVSQFTSEQNVLYFGPLNSADASNAAVGDTLGCMYYRHPS